MTVTAGADGRLLKALRREQVDATPVWFMRQAGRALPEYRQIRERYTFVEVCRTPDLAAEVTLQPVELLGVDAAVIFADIMTPLIGIGVEIDLVDGVGPVVANPIGHEIDADALVPIEPECDVPDVLEAIREVRRRLEERPEIAVIGFSGAPFTLASYLIEGRSSRDFHRTKRMMYAAPDLWQKVMERLANIVTLYLVAQIEAGAQAVQLFDTWAGALSPSDYCRFVRPYSAQILSALAETDVPVIHFGTGTAGFLESFREAGGSAVGVDWRISLDTAWSRIGFDRGIQGNLDPMVLLGPVDNIAAEARAILASAGGRPGHVFNLGHGVHPETPVENLKRLVDVVHEYDAVPREIYGH